MLYLLILISVVSIALILERAWFYKVASKGLKEFRAQIRSEVELAEWDKISKVANARTQAAQIPDLETEMTLALITQSRKGVHSPEILSEIAEDAVIRAKLNWDKNLSLLATIGANSPFVGLFGTVLGIIKAFHDLSQQATTGVQGVTSGISEALIATAMGLLVAIPAVVAFNLYQRRVKTAVSEAEALKSYLVCKLSK